MKNITQFAAAAMIAAVAFFAGSNSQIPTGPYATIDIEKVINDFAEDNVLFENLKNEKKARDSALESLRESIETQQQIMELKPRASREFQDLMKAIELDKQKYQLEARANDMWFSTRKGEITKEIYKKALGVIEAYAKENGILAVHLATKPTFDQAMRYEDVSSQIVVRALVYSSETIDITEAVQKLMKK